MEAQMKSHREQRKSLNFRDLCSVTGQQWTVTFKGRALQLCRRKQKRAKTVESEKT